MSEYRHTIHKGNFSGVSQDPSQDSSYAGETGVDKTLTIKNAVLIGFAYQSGKKIMNVAVPAIVGQFGNSRIDRALDAGGTILKYAGAGFVAGPIGLGAVAVADISTLVVDNLVSSHQQNLENSRTEFDRGEIKKIGMSGFYG